MKIKGPGSYSGPPSPDFKGDEKKVGKFQPEKLQQGPEQAKAKTQTQTISDVEKGLSEVARAAKAEGLKGEALAAKVVDTVLSQMFGKEFLSHPDAAALRETITPFVAQDEHLSSKINNLISRMGNKS
jgi:hypothetical protein